MTPDERAQFDALVEACLDELPEQFRAHLEEIAVIVEDEASAEMRRELQMDDDELLCGLHSGTSLTERSLEDPMDGPETIHLFRRDIIALAGGWEAFVDEDGTPRGGADAVHREICITLRHELGHHFGLEESDLDELGYA